MLTVLRSLESSSDGACIIAPEGFGVLGPWFVAFQFGIGYILEPLQFTLLLHKISSPEAYKVWRPQVAGIDRHTWPDKISYLFR